MGLSKKLYLLTVTAALAAAMPARGEDPKALDGSLVYTSVAPPNRDLFLVDGDAVKPLTRLPGLEYHAAPTPDGRFVVFTSEQGGAPDLWIVDLEGGDARPLYESEIFEDAAEISPDGKRIAFVSSRSGAVGIYLADFRPDDPTALDRARLLTPEEGSDFRPTFSPDGRWIAYSSTRGLPFSGGSHLWIVAADRSGEEGAPRRIVVEQGWNGSPAWSADGRSIAYHQFLPYPGDHPDLIAAASVWEVDVESGERRRLSAEDRVAAYPVRHPDGGWLWSERSEQGWRLSFPDGSFSAGEQELMMPACSKGGLLVAHGPGPRPEGDGMAPMLPPILIPGSRHPRRVGDVTLDLLPVYAAFPALSPDRSTLATGAMALQLVDMSSGEARDVFRPEGLAPTFPSVWSPSWSPDGRWLVVTAGAGFARPDAPVDVWRVAADGSEAVNLTADSPGNDALAKISPDGRWIVFRSGRDGQMDLYLMNADGSQVRRLTDHAATDTMPSFSPDGRQIAFSSTRGGNHDIYLLTLDDRGEAVGTPRQMTFAPGMDVHPQWSPDGRWLVVTTDRWGWNDELDFVFINFQPYGEIAAIRLEDRHVVRLTHNNWEEAFGFWTEGPVPGP